MKKRNKSKIYDCFPFFNELDLLEIRLSELYDAVDYFVICESTVTHSGKPKPLYYKKNKKRYKKWSDKIIHLIYRPSKKELLNCFERFVEKKVKSEIISKILRKINFGRWKIESLQRNYLINGLKNAKDYDIILLSDADEIFSKEAIKKAQKILEKNPEKIIRFRQKMYYYYLNGLTEEKWECAKACTFKTLKEKIKKMDYLRNWKIIYRFLSLIRMKPMLKKEILIKDGGWHFSYLGGAERIIQKLENFAHFEFDKNELKNKEEVKNKIDKGINFINKNYPIKYVKIDKSFPEVIQKHKNKYKHLIKWK